MVISRRLLDIHTQPGKWVGLLTSDRRSYHGTVSSIGWVTAPVGIMEARKVTEERLRLKGYGSRTTESLIF